MITIAITIAGEYDAVPYLGGYVDSWEETNEPALEVACCISEYLDVGVLIHFHSSPLWVYSQASEQVQSFD